MVDDDMLYRFRLRLFSLAGELGKVREACRLMGVHPSTYYRWRRPVMRSGLEMLRPRERRPPRMPNQTSQAVERRIVAFSLGHPGLGPRRISATLAQERWGGILVSPNGVWRVLRRHGLSRRMSRLSLVAGYAAPPGPERPVEVERHARSTIQVSLASTASTWAGSPGRSGRVWQYSTIDLASSYVWRSCTRRRHPSAMRTSQLAKRVAADLRSHGWRLERVLRDNGWGPLIGVRPHHTRAGRGPDPHPPRPADDQRRRRAGPANHPGGVLAAIVRPEPGAQARRTHEGPRGPPRLRRHRACPHRSPDRRTDTRRSSERAR